MSYRIKFMFADAVTMEEEFGDGITILACKQALIMKWPAEKDKVGGPEDLKVIYSGKVLDNDKTFEDYKVPRGSQVIMHIQPRPPQAQPEKKAEAAPPATKPPAAGGSLNRCCTIS
mmetsp:Transcript_31864/g.75073  ORF Transcript_31864/g.75073 Transcript_31864/m.75073 type:complete len:116 (-) Transcript_31864:170-517(-)